MRIRRRVEESSSRVSGNSHFLHLRTWRTSLILPFYLVLADIGKPRNINAFQYEEMAPTEMPEKEKDRNKGL